MGELELGRQFAGYRIDAVIGRGGMGVVYRAHQIRLDRPVALKVIADELARDPQFRSRFERESRLAASIEHANVIPIYEAGESDGILFLAMRFVDGVDLGSMLAGRATDPEWAAARVARVAAALDAAHRAGLVHRDVKPGNILIGREEQVYLTDFGLTKRASSDSGLTRSGQWVGTIDYIAPEQIRGERIDGRADVYSLGCVLYQCLTGSVPYERDSEVSQIYAHLEAPVPNALEIQPALPVGLQLVLERALAKDPDERYSSAGDLSRATTAALTGQPARLQERSVAAGEAAPAWAQTVATRDAPGAHVGYESQEHPRRLRRWWIPVAALVIGAGAAVGALAATGVIGGGGASTTERTASPSPSPSQSPPVIGEQSDPPTTVEKPPSSGESVPTRQIGPMQSLRQHFNLLLQGRYEKAVEDLTPTLLATVDGRDEWIRGQVEDDLEDFSLDAYVSDRSETSATVIVNALRTISVGNGCKVFTGSYGLLPAGDRWQLNSADLSVGSC